MSRKMVVVPYEWVKRMIRYPPDVQRKTDESQMVRELNNRFPDDFGQEERPPPQPAPVPPPQPAPIPPPQPAPLPPPEPASEEPPTPKQHKPLHAPGAPRKTRAASKEVVFSQPYANVKRQLFDAGVINKHGNVLSSAGKPNVRSNIHDIMNHLTGTRKKTAVGAAEIRKKMDQLGISLPQKGAGRRRWIRL